MKQQYTFNINYLKELDQKSEIKFSAFFETWHIQQIRQFEFWFA